MAEVLIRSQLVASISERLLVREKLVQEIMQFVLDEVRTALVAGKRVEIRGFGVFTPKYRPSRNARNPSNGELVVVPPRYIIQFRPGKRMRESVDFHRNVENAEQ